MPNKKDHLLVIGVNTGNSLDAADALLTVFDQSGDMRDVLFHSNEYPDSLKDELRQFREHIVAADGNVDAVAASTLQLLPGIKRYTTFVAQTVNDLVEKARTNTELAAAYDLSSIDAIGFHGQTCAHKPPSMAASKQDAFTVQIGDGQLMADLTNITTIYDFRSDDIINGGEGAPLAPMHNRHIAEILEKRGEFPITFINAGNTSNLAHITRHAKGELTVVGWDAGPCNDFIDLLMRKEKNLPYDEDGTHSQSGKINLHLLRVLFEKSAVTPDGENFLEKAPPKSSDPQWYIAPDMLFDPSILFEDRLRTAAYFSAYLLFHSFGYTNEALDLPARIALAGGGWKNPVVRHHFTTLLEGDFENNPVLPEHRARFESIRKRLDGKTVSVRFSQDYGFDGQAMEARLFADMARCRIMGTPFTDPALTGCTRPAVCGIIRYPQKSPDNASANLRAWLATHPCAHAPHDNPDIFNEKWSRASAGWDKKLSSK
ncbi:MAG: anhydro-N-acetylmuramic acid kinase [Alphaproteobacteria bacterium]|nr:anhydro-N-acetylmuramic acid kinase [Alphaproteobacteria bacterium]